MELFITKKHTMDFQKTPYNNALLLLQFSAVLSGNLEFSDGFVRLNKINRQTNLISSPKPNPHPSNHRASLGNNNNGPTHLILLEVKNLSLTLKFFRHFLLKFRKNEEKTCHGNLRMSRP